jgi:two-component system phosphate regulon response regulator PhoB
MKIQRNLKFKKLIGLMNGINSNNNPIQWWKYDRRKDETTSQTLVLVSRRYQGAQRELDEILPDVILLDWMLPGESGLTLARRWRSSARTKAVPILMLTARGDEADRVAGLDAGADDYIVKPFSPRELLARIRAVLRRRVPESNGGAVKMGELQLDADTYRVTWQDKQVKVGPTEFKLLHYLMRHPERVHTRGMLLDKVWGDHVYIEERTVDVHVKRLRESLGGAGSMIETVRGAGYRMTGSPSV